MGEPSRESRRLGWLSRALGADPSWSSCYIDSNALILHDRISKTTNSDSWIRARASGPGNRSSFAAEVECGDPSLFTVYRLRVKIGRQLLLPVDHCGSIMFGS